MAGEAKDKPNPYSWLTPELFHRFAESVNVRPDCEVCGDDRPRFVDTGNTDGIVPRSSAYGSLPSGEVNMGNSLHMPAVRTACMKCGTIRLHMAYTVLNWRYKLPPNNPDHISTLEYASLMRGEKE